MTSSKQQKGVIDPISIIAGLFLVVTLIVGTVVVNDRDFSLNISEKASGTGNSCFDECRKDKGRVYCNNLCGININWQGEQVNTSTNTSTTGGVTCDANGKQYSAGSVVIYGGIGDYRTCINGRWEVGGTLADIKPENVPQYAQDVYQQAVQEAQSSSGGGSKPEPSLTQPEIDKFCNVSMKESFCGTGTNNCPNGKYCQIWISNTCDEKIVETTQTCTVSNTGQTIVDTKECSAGSKECDGNTLKTCSQNGFWVSQNCQYGCLNKACISSVSTSVEVNRDDEGTTRDLTVIIRDENQDVITANTTPITINTQSPTVEKTDDGFVRTVTTVINNADTGEIINAITQNIASIKKSNGDYCSYDGECNSGKCDFAGTPVRRCVPNITQVEMAYNGLETLTFGTFGDYVNAYQNPYMTWQIQGFDSSRDFIEDCVAKNGISAAQNCTRQASALSQDALASSTALGTVITSEVALLGTGVSYLSGGLTGVQALYQGLAISSLYQTGSAVDICNTNPDSIECRDAKIWAAISWINVGTAANLANSATQTAKLINTGVNALNLAGDVAIDVNYNCFGENKNDLGCALAVGATVLDFGGGAFDLVDILKPTKVAQAIFPLPNNYVDVGVDQLTDIYIGTIPSEIKDGALGFSKNFLTNNQPVVSPIDGLVNALEASGVKLSFPDVTINNWTNSLNNSLTGNISVTTLDTAILPNGSPTNLDNVLAQADNIPSAAVITDTPNVSANPPLLTRIEDWWGETRFNPDNWIAGAPIKNPFADEININVGRESQPSLFNQPDISRNHGIVTIDNTTGQIRYTDTSTNGSYYRNAANEEFKFINPGESISITSTTEIKLYNSQPIKFTVDSGKVSIVDVNNNRVVDIYNTPVIKVDSTKSFLNTYLKDETGWFPALRDKYDVSSPIAQKINIEVSSLSSSKGSLEHIETVDTYIKEYGNPKYIFTSESEAKKLYDFQKDLLKINGVEQYDNVYKNTITKIKNRGIKVVTHDNLYEFLDAVSGGNMDGTLGAFIPEQFTNGKRTGTLHIASPELLKRLLKYSDVDVSIETAKMITLQKIGHEGGHSFDWVIGGVTDYDIWLTEIRQINFNYSFYKHIGNENEAMHYKAVIDEFNSRFMPTSNNQPGQVLVEFSAAMPVVMAIPAAGLYFADQYFDLGIVDAMTSSINEALEPTQNKSSNITDPVYNTVNFWANTASIIYAINNDKELSEIAINNPNQRPYDEIIQEAIDNYTANNPNSDIYYSPNPNALSLTDIFKQTFNKDSLEIISTTLADEEFKKLSLSGKIMKLSNNLLTDRNTFIDSVVGAAANIGLFTKDGGTYPISGFENEVENLTAIIESEVENTGNPVSHSFVIEYFLDKSNGDLSQAILDSSNFEEFLTRSLDGEIVDDPYVWIQNHILDEYSPILPYHVLSTNEEVLENSQIYYDYSLPNRLGQVYHAANISALLNYLPPEVVRAMVIGEYLSYGEKHGLIKMSADLEILKRLDEINDLLKSYEQSNN